MTATALKLLHDDHKALEQLLTDLCATAERSVDEQVGLLVQVAAALDLHTRCEEEIFYPAVRARMVAAEELRLYYEALEEHRAARLVLGDLQRSDPRSPQFGGRAKVLAELVDHHADEEEEDLFPLVRELMTAEELGALGERLIAFRLDTARAAGHVTAAAQTVGT